MIHASRLLLAAVVLLVLGATAIAGLKITEKPEGWQLTAGTKVTGYATYEECLKAIRVLGPGDYKCKNSTAIKAEFTCDDVPMPVMPTVVNAEGFTILPGIVVEQLADGTWGPTKEEGFVKGPGFPNCWIPGLVPYKGKFTAPDGPPVQDPSPWIYGYDYGTKAPYDKTCPKEAVAGCIVLPNLQVPPPAYSAP